MNLKLLVSGLITASVLLVVGLLWLTRPAATASTPESQLVPTPFGVSPQPTRTTQPDGDQCGNIMFCVTPTPNEQVRLGPVSTVIPTPIPTVAVSTGNDGFKTLTIRNPMTHEEVRLGDDRGDAELQGATDRYVLWKFCCTDSTQNGSVPTGLYAYDLTNGNTITISQDYRAQWYPEIDGYWVVYVKFAYPARDFPADVHAHNLHTNEDIRLGELDLGMRPVHQNYALQGTQVVWVEAGSKSSSTILRVYDLATHTATTLDIPDVASFHNVSISDNVVVWWSEYWQGYDMTRQARFTIPITPPGWEQVPIQGVYPVTILHDQLTWGVQVKEQAYYFTAPLIRSP